MKRLITTEEVEFIVLQLLDQGKLDEAEKLLAENKMTGSEWDDLKSMRYSFCEDETQG
jgi:hypothetical protein